MTKPKSVNNRIYASQKPPNPPYYYLSTDMDSYYESLLVALKKARQLAIRTGQTQRVMRATGQVIAKFSYDFTFATHHANVPELDAVNKFMREDK